MKMRTFVGLCAALAFAMGSTAVRALEFVDGPDTDPEHFGTGAYARGTVAYARETLLSGGANTTKGHYNIVRPHHLTAPSEIRGVAADGFVVSYDLNGMVFSGQPELSATGITFSIASGGMGTSSVKFLKDETGEVSPETLLALTATFAVSENGGTISRTVSNASLLELGIAGRSKTRTATIAVRPALRETVKPTRPAPVVSGFTTFGGSAGNPVLRTSLGTVEIGVVSPNLRHAQAATDVDGAPGANVESLVDIAPPALLSGPIANPVTFSGNFDFVKTVALATDCRAGPFLTNILVPSADETRPRDATTFPEGRVDVPGTGDEPADALHLCLEVDGETAIPPTDTYKVMTSYRGIADAAFPPAGAESELAGIKRDGTTVHIPLLNLHENYNHRVVLRNRSGRMVDYDISFNPEDGTTATPGPMASGMLDAGKWVFMKASDIVTLSGNQRTSATLTSDAPSGTLDVSTSLTNLMNRTTDTETH